ncbi:MAG: carboxypeptidase-like regulatory domain-containing protein, partial [Bacteroidota bacterium]
TPIGRRAASEWVGGRYRIEEVYYDGEATVRVAPTSLVRQFDPATRDAILSLDAFRVEEVDFIDTTTITITGTVTQAEGATICPQSGITVTARSLGNGRETTATTQPDGTYVITLEEPGAYTVTPRYENHAFAPTNVTRSFLQRLDTLNFRDEQRHTFSGKFRGSCDTYLGVARLLLYDGEDPASSCFVTSVLSAPETGDFSVELPARTYTVEVDSFAPAPDIALDPTEVVAAFAAGTEVDLDTADVNQNLTFRSPISVAIDVPEDYFLCDQERYPHPVFGQYTLVPLTFRVEESFRDQSCPVDTGLLRITDRIGDVDSTILLPFVNGRAEYQSFIG